MYHIFQKIVKIFKPIGMFTEPKETIIEHHLLDGISFLNISNMGKILKFSQ